MASPDFEVQLRVIMRRLDACLDRRDRSGFMVQSAVWRGVRDRRAREAARWARRAGVTEPQEA